MKSLKISLVATLAAMIAWWLGFARRIWPAHPMLAVTLLAVGVCILLQFAWSTPAGKGS
jgi:hypothetical protein